MSYGEFINDECTRHSRNTINERNLELHSELIEREEITCSASIKENTQTDYQLKTLLEENYPAASHNKVKKTILPNL